MTLSIGDFIFTADTSYLSRFNRWVSGNAYSHVVVYIGDGLIVESSWSGVVITGLKRYLNDSTHCTAVRLPEHIDKDKFIKELYKKIGDSYDYRLLFGHLISRICKLIGSWVSKYDSPTKWLCYEVIGKSLEDSGEDFDIPVAELDPQKLFDFYKKEDNTWTL